MELTITIGESKSYSMRLTPSNRVFRTIRTETYGDTWERTVLTANTVADGIEKIASRGYLTRFEQRFTLYPYALAMSEQSLVKHRDMIVYRRALVVGG